MCIGAESIRRDGREYLEAEKQIEATCLVAHSWNPSILQAVAELSQNQTKPSYRKNSPCDVVHPSFVLRKHAQRYTTFLSWVGGVI